MTNRSWGCWGNKEQVQAAGSRIRAAVMQRVGVSVCVGVAGSKTLAKFANRIAKQNPAPGGKTTARLKLMGLESIADLKAANPALIRKKFSVVLQRTVLELNGTECVPHSEERVDKQQVMFSRSFSEPVTMVAGMEEVAGVYAQRGAARLQAA